MGHRYQNGGLVESELAFFAQDDDGNVWNLGEYPELYEGGVFIGAPSTWIAGLAGARAGVHMPARPRVGAPSYLQGLAPKIEFLDCAQVFRPSQRVSVPFGDYDNVPVTNEWRPLEVGSGIQRKFHAPGVGIVEITAVGDPERETLSLVNFAHLTPEALAQVRTEALKVETRAYQVSGVYR